MINFKNVSIPKLLVCNSNREFAVDNGIVYINGTPVPSYCEKNMYYFEHGGEQGTVHLRHYGLMAEIITLKDNVRSYVKAGGELCYHLTFDNNGTTEIIDLSFGISMDSSGQSHYYCGLKYNEKEIIPIPTTDNDKFRQGVMSNRPVPKRKEECIMG